jgi:hypothetical protein
MRQRLNTLTMPAGIIIIMLPNQAIASTPSAPRPMPAGKEVMLFVMACRRCRYCILVVCCL